MTVHKLLIPCASSCYVLPNMYVALLQIYVLSVHYICLATTHQNHDESAMSKSPHLGGLMQSL